MSWKMVLHKERRNKLRMTKDGGVLSIGTDQSVNKLLTQPHQNYLESHRTEIFTQQLQVEKQFEHSLSWPVVSD